MLFTLHLIVLSAYSDVFLDGLTLECLCLPAAVVNTDTIQENRISP